MSISVEDLRAVPDEEWDDLYLEVLREQERRTVLRTAPDRMDDLLTGVREAMDGPQPATAPVDSTGTDSQPTDQADSYPEWTQPTGAHDAYPQGWIVRHGGRLWISLVSGNSWEPGADGPVPTWREVTPTDTGEAAGSASGGGQPWPAWEAGHPYLVGDRVTYSGHVWRCAQAHMSLAAWEPPTVPALWTQAD